MPETFRRVKALGFKGLELSFDPDGPIGLASTADEMHALRRAADDAGLTLTSLATGAFWANNFSQDDPKKREIAHRNAIKMLELGQALGVKALLIVPGAVDICCIPQEPVVAYDVVMERIVSAMRRLIPYCERAQVRIGMENVWNKFFLSPLEMRDVIDNIDCPLIGAYFDVGNVLPYGYPEQWIRILGSRIVSVHLKDFRRAVGTLDGFVDLLEGDVNWPAVMGALQEIGYAGPLVAEMIPAYRHHALARVENTSNAMDWILGRKTNDSVFQATPAVGERE
ncbi:MAG TPA: sugar phosphate isomerase/epimerase family protein [Armatimonadota bacterium]|nr:sugar phosphate isomerase/epimerase family protein [Armatimonadota bacterium]